MLKLNKDQFQLFNDFEKLNNEIHGKPMTAGEKREYEKKVSMLYVNNNYYYTKP